MQDVEKNRDPEPDQFETPPPPESVPTAVRAAGGNSGDWCGCVAVDDSVL